MYRVSLKAARVNKELTQTEAGIALGVSKCTVNNWEKGKTSPDFAHLKRICEIYEVPMDTLILPIRSTLS